MGTRSANLLCLVGALAGALAACGDDPKPPMARTVDDVFAEMTAAGVAAEDVVETDGAAVGGGRCKKGRVSGVEVIACRHETEAAAKAARPTALAALGEATGSAITSGPVLLVAVDRAGSDPAGKVIDGVTRAFLRKPLGTSAASAK
jgi:hypothetical protein